MFWSKVGFQWHQVTSAKSNKASSLHSISNGIPDVEGKRWTAMVVYENSSQIIEGSLEVKLPTIWTNEKQRWEDSEKRREEERESLRRKKIQVRKKVGKSRNTVFFQWFLAQEGLKVGSLKRRVRSHLARWEMKKCTPLWREAHFQVKMYKTHQLRTTFGSCDVEKVHAVVARIFWSWFPGSKSRRSCCLAENIVRHRLYLLTCADPNTFQKIKESPWSAGKMDQHGTFLTGRMMINHDKPWHPTELFPSFFSDETKWRTGVAELWCPPPVAWRISGVTIAWWRGNNCRLVFFYSTDTSRMISYDKHGKSCLTCFDHEKLWFHLKKRFVDGILVSSKTLKGPDMTYP